MGLVTIIWRNTGQDVMNESLIWQIIDTSVKVGLGAVIAGFFTWLLVSRRQQGQENPLTNRRMAILESTSADVGAVTHAFSKYAALVTESIHYGDRWPTTRREELTDINVELVNEFKKLANVQSQLLMLGEKNMERALRIYAAKIAIFRKEVYVCRKDITETEIHVLKQEINDVKEKFYDILSMKYDRLLAGG
ncbi:energy transducer TonB [Marinibactrum halimedae]|uniref:Energy transducer TonB n=1 Tax=Marinibactrum halimedae TaxID=1444977 RepID=A0AA37T3Z3_9GAMM|nr:energy transducer TonB [Marinibactrum halimedae]MCD9457925.1 energy transducer TonB [Marinibactrum halimedae]GLS26250.1 hypothetical protein GCM10007877_19650 [Marinibactrum halimedae]